MRSFVRNVVDVRPLSKSMWRRAVAPQEVVGGRAAEEQAITPGLLEDDAQFRVGLGSHRDDAAVPQLHRDVRR